MDRHAARGLAKVTQTLAVIPATGEATADELESLLQGAKGILANAGSHTQALDAIDRCLRVVVARGAWQAEQERLELLRKPAQTIDLLRSDQWLELRAVLDAALVAHDLKHGHEGPNSARLAVADAMSKHEQ
jgi:hypothetical protein